MRRVIAFAIVGLLAACGSQAPETRTARVWTTGGGFSSSPDYQGPTNVSVDWDDDYEGPADSTGDFGPADRNGTPEPGGTDKPLRGE